MIIKGKTSFILSIPITSAGGISTTASESPGERAKPCSSLPANTKPVHRSSQPARMSPAHAPFSLNQHEERKDEPADFGSGRAAGEGSGAAAAPGPGGPWPRASGRKRRAGGIEATGIWAMGAARAAPGSAGGRGCGAEAAGPAAAPRWEAADRDRDRHGEAFRHAAASSCGASLGTGRQEQAVSRGIPPEEERLGVGRQRE